MAYSYKELLAASADQIHRTRHGYSEQQEQQQEEINITTESNQYQQQNHRTSAYDHHRSAHNIVDNNGTEYYRIGAATAVGGTVPCKQVRRPHEVARFLRQFEVKDRTDVINNLLSLGLRHYQMLTGGEADLRQVKAAGEKIRRIPAPAPASPDYEGKVRAYDSKPVKRQLPVPTGGGGGGGGVATSRRAVSASSVKPRWVDPVPLPPPAAGKGEDEGISTGRKTNAQDRSLHQNREATSLSALIAQKREQLRKAESHSDDATVVKEWSKKRTSDDVQDEEEEEEEEKKKQRYPSQFTEEQEALYLEERKRRNEKVKLVREVRKQCISGGGGDYTPSPQRRADSSLDGVRLDVQQQEADEATPHHLSGTLNPAVAAAAYSQVEVGDHGEEEKDGHQEGDHQAGVFSAVTKSALDAVFDATIGSEDENNNNAADDCAVDQGTENDHRHNPMLDCYVWGKTENGNLEVVGGVGVSNQQYHQHHYSEQQHEEVVEQDQQVSSPAHPPEEQSAVSPARNDMLSTYSAQQPQHHEKPKSSSSPGFDEHGGGGHHISNNNSDDSMTTMMMPMSNAFLDSLEHTITVTRGQRLPLHRLVKAMPEHAASINHEAFPRLYRTMLTSYHSRAGLE